jgi:hypothetical protein
MFCHTANCVWDFRVNSNPMMESLQYLVSTINHSDTHYNIKPQERTSARFEDRDVDYSKSKNSVIEREFAGLRGTLLSIPI